MKVNKNTDPKIAKIIDDYNVVLNKGANINIKAGQEFLLYEQTDEIIDPETGEMLECLFMPKGKGVVIRVQEKICVLRSCEWEKPSSIAEAFSILAPSQKLKPFENPVIGDCAVKLSDENDASEDNSCIEEFAPKDED